MQLKISFTTVHLTNCLSERRQSPMLPFSVFAYFSKYALSRMEYDKLMQRVYLYALTVEALLHYILIK